MTLNHALLYCGQLVSFGLFLSGVEFLRLSGREAVQKIWSPEILVSEYRKSLPVPEFIRQWLASSSALRQLAIAEMIFSIAALISPTLGFYVALLCVHFLICLRFRGTFNGGSDQMFIQVLIGLCFGFGLYSQGYGRWALIYIAIQLLYSYFKAGFVKVRERTWRNGSAIAKLLETSPFEGIRSLSPALAMRPLGLRVVAWCVILCECLMPLAIFNTRWAQAACVAAFLFHLVNVQAFGLNRFFWAWMSAWPAVLYLSRSIV